MPGGSVQSKLNVSRPKGGQMSLAVQFSEYGTTDVLHVVDVAAPTVGPGQGRCPREREAQLRDDVHERMN